MKFVVVDSLNTDLCVHLHLDGTLFCTVCGTESRARAHSLMELLSNAMQVYNLEAGVVDMSNVPVGAGVIREMVHVNLLRAAVDLGNALRGTQVDRLEDREPT